MENINLAEGMKKRRNIDKYSLQKGIVLLFLIVVFALLFFMGGVKKYPDTAQYLDLNPNREPGYSILLNVVTLLFGERGFFVLGFLQNVMAVWAVYLTASYIGSKFRGKYILPLVTGCLLLPYVVTPLFTSSGLILTNAMMSEGVTLSCYNLFAYFMLKSMWEEDKQRVSFMFALGVAFLLSIMRGQMIVTLLVWLCISIFIWIRQKKWKKILETAFLFIFVLLCRTVFIHSFNLIVNGVYGGTTYGDVTILSNVIYASDRESGEAIKDSLLHRLFEEIYEVADSGNMLYHDAPKDFSQEAYFYSSMHDQIKDIAIYPVLQSYVEIEEGTTAYMEMCMRVDELASAMTKELFGANIKVWTLNYLKNVAVGFIRTVAYVHPLLNIPTLFGYIILFLAGAFVYWKKRDSKVVDFFLLSMLMTVGNVLAVALTIMCLSRYMIYNMSFVYITALLLFTEIWRKDKAVDEIQTILI